MDSYFNSLDDGTYKVVFSPDSGLELQNEAGEIIETSKVNSSLYYNRETKPKIVTHSDSRDLPFQSASLTLRNYKYLGLAELSFPGLWAYRGQCAGSPVLGDSIKD
jgi:hypothetical protein